MIGGYDDGDEDGVGDDYDDGGDDDDGGGAGVIMIMMVVIMINMNVWLTGWTIYVPTGRFLFRWADPANPINHDDCDDDDGDPDGHGDGSVDVETGLNQNHFLAVFVFFCQFVTFGLTVGLGWGPLREDG